MLGKLYEPDSSINELGLVGFRFLYRLKNQSDWNEKRVILHKN